MAAATFQFELVSPEALIVSKPAALVTVPGGEGDFGVLPGHSPLIATVRPGVIDIYEQEGAISDRIFVAGGFAEVTADRCTVLAEEALPVKQIDRAKTEKEAAELEVAVAAATSDVDRELVEVKLSIVKAKLDAIAA